MKRIPETLASRLTLWYAGIFALFFGAAFLFFYLFIDAVLNEGLDEDLQEDIVEFRMLWESEGIDRVRAEIRREMESSDPDEIFLRLLDADGGEIFASDMSHWRDLAVNREALAEVLFGSGPVLDSMRRDDHEYGSRVVYGLIAPGVIIHIGESMEGKEQFMELLFKVFAGTFLVVVLLAALVGWFMARQALSGVDEVSRAAVDVANGTLDRQVCVKARGTEIERLVATFNVMVKRIRGLIFGMREMTDNIAHDMRSPLARIRANSELALSSATTLDEYKASAADTLEECDRLLQMINTTLDVAEAEAGAARLVKDKVNISQIVRDACELFEPIAEDRDIELSLEIEPECQVQGNTQYLQRMVANLLDNALKYTPPPGKVDVAMAAGDGHVSIAIRDTGIGISEADQPHIWERFFRCDHSRSQPGFGLGLSFARAVALAHAGSLDVSSRPGQGSVFTVILPV